MWLCVYECAAGWRPICFIHRKNVEMQIAFLGRFGFNRFGPIVEMEVPVEETQDEEQISGESLTNPFTSTKLATRKET